MKDPVSRWLRWNPTRIKSSEIRLAGLIKVRLSVSQMVWVGNLWTFAVWPEQTKCWTRAGGSSPQRWGARGVPPPSHSAAPSQTCCCRCYCQQCQCSQSSSPAVGRGAVTKSYWLYWNWLQMISIQIITPAHIGLLGSKSIYSRQQLFRSQPVAHINT